VYEADVPAHVDWRAVMEAIGTTRSSGAGCEQGRSDAAIRCTMVQTVANGNGARRSP